LPEVGRFAEALSRCHLVAQLGTEAEAAVAAAAASNFLRAERSSLLPQNLGDMQRFVLLLDHISARARELPWRN
jgi:hypothetical protein